MQKNRLLFTNARETEIANRYQRKKNTFTGYCQLQNYDFMWWKKKSGDAFNSAGKFDTSNPDLNVNKGT